MAWIVPVIKGAAAVYGAYQAYRSGQDSKKVADSQKSLTDEQLRQAKALQPLALKFLAEGDQAFAPAFQRYLALSTGNRDEMLKYLAPEIDTLNRENTAALRASDQFSPRGGGRLAARYANLPFRTSDAISRLVYGARSDATDKLAALSSDRTGKGLGALGAMFGGLQGASGSNTDLYRIMAGNRASAIEEGTRLGSSIYDIYDEWQRSRNPAPTGGSGGYP